MDSCLNLEEIHVNSHYFLCRLPDEVILKIFRLQPPWVLTILQSSEDERIKRLSLDVRVGNFNTCFSVSLHDVQNFTHHRLSRLTELYLDNLFYLNSRILEKHICKCKRLQILSVMNCGFEVESLFNFLNIPNLLELSCTVLESNNAPTSDNDICLWLKELSSSKFKFPSELRKLHLDVADLTSMYYFLIPILVNGFKLEEIELNFAFFECKNFLSRQKSFEAEIWPDIPSLCSFVITWPFETSNSKVHQIIIREWKKFVLLPFLQWMFHKTYEERTWKKFWITDISESDEIYKICSVKPETLSSSSHLFLSEDRNMLHNCQHNSVHHLGFVTPCITDCQVKDIEYACGKSLSTLILCSEPSTAVLMEINTFQRILDACYNITVLDITGIHVEDYHGTSLCSAISALKGLCKLSLPVCAVGDEPQNEPPSFVEENSFIGIPFRKRQTRQNVLYHSAAAAFTNMVKSCSLVTDFSLTGCGKCNDKGDNLFFCDSVIGNACLWKHLKHVTIESIYSLHLQNFVVSIAKECHNFTSLHLINAGKRESFIYLQSVIHVLLHSKSFSFLRIIHPAFDVSNSRFWSAVSKAVNLRGLCLNSDKECIQYNIIERAIRKLQHFHLLHLHGMHFSESKYPAIRKITKSLCRDGPNKRSIVVATLCGSVWNKSSLGCHIFHYGIRDFCVKCPAL